MTYSPFRHLGLKLMAVALAALLWLIVAGDHLVERSLRVPLEYRNIPPELELVGDPPTEVDVRLRGSSALLGRLETRDVIAVLDLAAARPGSRMMKCARPMASRSRRSYRVPLLSISKSLGVGRYPSCPPWTASRRRGLSSGA
jgi:hypothetical protein